MEIRQLEKAAFAGKCFTARYLTKGYYDIRPAETGFRMQYVPFGEAIERSFEDEFFGQWLDNPVAYGAFEGERLLGFVEGAMEQWNNRFRISNLCVFEAAARQHGIGTALMGRILEEAAKTGARMAVLETQSCNETAIAFYRKNGFELIGFDLYAYSNSDPERHEVRIEMGKKVQTMRTTERLLLRKWTQADADSLYEYAKDPEVGPPAGWPPHKSREESLSVIQNVFCGTECYAVCEKDSGRAIGAIELMLNGPTSRIKRDDECELGYWLGRPFWGRGLMPEAAEELLRRAFEELGMQKVWCGYYDGNEKSKRVQEKLGFRYHHTCENVPVPLMHDTRTEHMNVLTKEQWEKQKS